MTVRSLGDKLFCCSCRRASITSESQVFCLLCLFEMFKGFSEGVLGRRWGGIGVLEERMRRMEAPSLRLGSGGLTRDIPKCEKPKEGLSALQGQLPCYQTSLGLGFRSFLSSK